MGIKALNDNNILFAFSNILTNLIITLVGIPTPGGTEVGSGIADIIFIMTLNILM